MESDIRSLDLNLLPVLAVLLEERSVTRAARRLNVTQSTVSGMLGRLRAALDDPLFVRSRHGILPTPRADAMAAPLRAWLAETNTLVAPAGFDPAEWAGSVALAATDYTQHVLLGAVISCLRARAPRLKVAIHPLHFEVLGEQLARGVFDLAISASGFVPTELASRKLMEERYVLAMGVEHPLTREPRVDLDAFCRYDHIVVSPSGGGFRGPVDDDLAKLGRHREVRVSVPSFSLVAELLSGSDLLCYTPERLVQGRPDIHVGEGPFERTAIDMVAVWHPRVSDDPAHRWLRDVVTQTARGL